MYELFIAMFREEWRIHSTMFGSISFALFPVLIAAITFMGSVILPYLEAVVPGEMLSFLIHAQFLLLGVMVGGFGLLGQEVMNRRFGQASLLAYSSRSLPLSDRHIFATFVAKDTVYYFLLWVFPFIAGITLGIPFSGLSLSFAGVVAVTLTLAFLFGLAMVFLLSMLYTRSIVLLAAVLIAGGVSALVVSGTGNTGLQYLFPPFALYQSFTPLLLLYSLVAIIIPFTLSIAYMSPEFMGRIKRFPNRYNALAAAFPQFRSAPLVAKDLLDLWRSGALVGQILFSFLLPLAIIWVTLSVLESVLPGVQILINFAVVAGIIAATMYTWLTEFDTIGTYTFLPLGTPDLIRSKLASFLILQFITVITVAGVAVISGEFAAIIPVTVLAISVSAYACAVMVYLAGLWPAVMVYDVRVLFSSMVLIGPVLLALIGISSIHILYAFASLLLLLPAYILVRLAFRKWETWEKAFY